jgi:hypothetical protein
MSPGMSKPAIAASATSESCTPRDGTAQSIVLQRGIRAKVLSMGGGGLGERDGGLTKAPEGAGINYFGAHALTYIHTLPTTLFPPSQHQMPPTPHPTTHHHHNRDPTRHTRHTSGTMYR